MDKTLKLELIDDTKVKLISESSINNILVLKLSVMINENSEKFTSIHPVHTICIKSPTEKTHDPQSVNSTSEVLDEVMSLFTSGTEYSVSAIVANPFRRLKPTTGYLL
ncbi:hypothetical protein JQC92_19780 [Shewanella sp. 202IG2-18]|uniref:hypothetical protein n=1 Tax=Parashewanella hymeniacidonis TaxID=2807618 RepID=UPI0019617E09|nr:hypothetical protein [Parashewanella hymeniacidonis]MBM7074238.1 hypothetical protein [Parashewanella hymeniacidonis]